MASANAAIFSGVLFSSNLYKLFVSFGVIFFRIPLSSFC